MGKTNSLFQLKHQIPSIYHGLIVDDILNLELIETKATCDDCAMAKPASNAKIANKKSVTYQKDLKCCTFEPYLPNYLVGQMLLNKSESVGFSRLQKRIDSRHGVLPIGIVAPLRYQVEFNARTLHDFGNRRDWLCSWYDEDLQNCSIWKFRSSVCNSFICKSSYGESGIQFWEQLGVYLNYVEMALMEEALVNLGYSARDLSDFLYYINRDKAKASELKQEAIEAQKYRKLWKDYFGQEREFYIKCYEFVKNLSKGEFREMMGDMGFEQEQLLLESIPN